MIVPIQPDSLLFSIVQKYTFDTYYQKYINEK